MVDPAIFDLEIDGSTIIHGVKTKGNVGLGKAKASSNVLLGMVGFSMFLAAIGLELNQEEFANQMVRFWHYLLKCITDVGVVLWQTYRGMLATRKLISQELTQPYVGRNKVLKDYYKWRCEQGKISLEQYTKIVKYQEEIEVELTEEQLLKLRKEENKWYTNYRHIKNLYRICNSKCHKSSSKLLLLFLFIDIIPLSMKMA